MKKRNHNTDFQKSLQALKDAADRAYTDLEKDGLIQRFEFTFEMAWKSVKDKLEAEGIQVNSPKSAIKEAFRQGWIDNERLWLDMLDDRNLSAHTYNQETASDIFIRIKEHYILLFEQLLQHIEKH